MINSKYKYIHNKKIKGSIFYLLLFHLIFAINSSVANAQEKALSFKDCIKELKENNKELVALKYEKEAAIYKLKSSKANYFPSLDANAGASSNKIDTGLGKDSDMYNWGLTLSQNLFKGFKDSANVDLAYANEAQNLANIAIAEARISKELKEVFSKIVYLKKYLELSKKITHRRNENFDVVNLRYEAGNENKGSFLKAKAQLKEARFEEKEAKRELDASLFTLAKILGRDSIENLDIKGEVPHTKYNVDSETLYLNNHPKLLLSKANVALSKAQVKIEEGDFYPSIDLTLKTGGSGGSVSKNIDHSIGVNANVPILNFGRDTNSLNEAKSNLSSMLERETLSKQEIKSDIKNAKANFLSSKEKVEVNKDLEEASEVRAEIGRNKYNIGMLTFENWDIIENDLISYQKSSLRSEYELIVAEANFENAIGIGVLND